MTILEWQSLGFSWGAKPVFAGLSDRILRGEFYSIVGSSGAGKTTLLKLLAGIHPPQEGRLVWNLERPKVPPLLVFQDYQLFEHLTVYENVAFGLAARKTPRALILSRVTDMLERWQIGAVAQAYPRQISGGQAQRVALARALVLDPEVILLDEPFAHLDPALSLQAARQLERLVQEFGVTVVCVTHHLEYALALSHRIAIMHPGQWIGARCPSELTGKARDTSPWPAMVPDWFVQNVEEKES